MASNSRLQAAIWIVKLAFYSTGLISMAVFLKHTIPCFLALALSALPRLWTSLRSWLAPPYLYIVVNFIILIIAVSSNFPPQLFVKNAQAKAGKVPEEQRHSVDQAPEDGSVEKIPTDPDEKAVELISGVGVSAVSSIKPLKAAVRRRVRRSASSSSRSLGASKPKELDTLDDTWKAITEGRGGQQPKQSGTWDAAPRVEAGHEKKGLAGGCDLKKWETFTKEAADASWVGLGREISLSKEDLNRQGEAFI